MLYWVDLIDAAPRDEDLTCDKSPQQSDVSIYNVRSAPPCLDASRIDDLVEKKNEKMVWRYQIETPKKPIYPM